MYIVFHAHYNTTLPLEMIEYAAIVLGKDGKKNNFINQTVRLKHSKLDGKAKRIQGITEKTLANSIGFEEVCDNLKTLFFETSSIIIFWDKSGINSLEECFKLYGQELEIRERVLFLSKVIYPEGIVKGLFETLCDLSLESIGTSGVAEYDCENIANIFINCGLSSESILKIVEEKGYQNKQHVRYRDLLRRKTKKAIYELHNLKTPITYQNVRATEILQELFENKSDDKIEVLENRIKDIYNKTIESNWYKKKFVDVEELE
jgi:hypothetical protein